MAEIFPRWINRAPRVLVAGLTGGSASLAFVVWYAFSPELTDVGYMPRQPIPFSHALHAGELEVDCRYCHTSVERSEVASLPPSRLCMNCHGLVAREASSLELLRESVETGEPLHWVRVHRLPDYARFDHAVHVLRGIGCDTCHGAVREMAEVWQAEPLSMRWCLDCHRDPPPETGVSSASTDCASCHR